MTDSEADRRRKTDRAVPPSHLKGAKRGRARGHLRVPLWAKVLVAVFALAAVFVVAYAVRRETNETHYLTSSELTEVVQESKLSTANYRYSGIAFKNPSEDGGRFDYAVYYESTVPASIDLSQVSFEKDEETKVFTVVLPEITLGDPNVDVSKLAYLPRNPDAEPDEILALCKEDALNEATSAGGVIEIARNNLHSAIEGLTLPLIEQEGYTLEFRDGEPEGDSQQSEVVADE